MIKLKTPLTLKDLSGLKAGDEVLLTGTIYTARDAAHKKLLAEKEAPPFLKGAVLYYAGPSPAPKGRPSGSIGPTTSARMDKYTPQMLEKTGIIAIIGKGGRSEGVLKAMRGRAVYMLAVGGAGALIGQTVKKSKAVLYPELGAEAVYELYVEDLPLFTGFDLDGKDIFKTGGK
ncbi:fumarate hydratase subunit beta [Parelusimicrobium proximum]|uniref:FumA C-terminus/TtdB family hydratase beta subunit n=1 Tax=Parelusimicrobium proximum TaxID=3228953 RepID=UPI003D17A432